MIKYKIEMNILKSTIKNNIWKIFLHRVFSSITFSGPIMVLFWFDNGLSLTEIMILQSLFALSVVVLEVPTGYFADMFGRKKALIIASIANATGIAFYSIGTNFWDFLTGEILMAVGVSFFSGTMSAFVYDTLQELGTEKSYQRIWGNISYYGMIALAVSSILGGFIAEINLRYTLFASIPFFAIAIPLMISLKEPKRKKMIISKGDTDEFLKIFKLVFIKNQKLKWIIIYSGIIYAFNQSALWLYQPYFQLSGLDIVYFGFVFASFQVVAAISSKYAYLIEKKLGEKYSLAVLLFLVAISYLLMHNFVYLFSFSFAFIQQFVRAFKMVVLTDYINKLTTSDIRATVLSLESLVSKMLYVIIIPIVGWFVDVYTLSQALLVLSITAFISWVVLLVIFNKRNIL